MLYLKEMLGNLGQFLQCASLADSRRFLKLRLIPSRLGVSGTKATLVWYLSSSANSRLFSIQSCSHFSRQVVSLLESSYFSQRLMVVWLDYQRFVRNAARSAFLNFFSFLMAASLKLSLASSAAFYFSLARVIDCESFSSIFFLSSSISRSFCSIFFSFDCIRILSLVFSFSTMSKVCFSFSNQRHFRESSSCTLLSSPLISISRSDCAMTVSWILWSSASCSFLRNCSSSNLRRLLPILKRLNIRILLISLVAQQGSKRMSSPSLHLCRSSVTSLPLLLQLASLSLPLSLVYLSLFCCSGTLVLCWRERSSKEMVKSIFLLRSSLILSRQQLMISKQSFLAASLVLIMCRCLTLEKMDFSSSFSFSRRSIFLSYWICTTLRTLSSSPLMLFSTNSSLSSMMVFSWSSLVTLLRYQAQRRLEFLFWRWRMSAACQLMSLFLSLIASMRMSWYCEKVSILFLNSFSVKVKSSLFMQLTQSSRSGTVMTNPYPEESRSTRETLLRKRLMNAWRKESLYC